MMQQKYGQIIGWGAYAPSHVVTNDDLSKIMDTSDEWIVQRTGIKERRWAEDGESGITMAVAAARDALEVSGLDANDLDLIIVGTSLVETLAPSVASYVQHQIGAEDVPAFDVSTGCTGFLYSLSTAYQFIATGAYENILVVGVEHLSQFLDFEDRATAVLFGDGAGAVIVQATDQPCGLQGFQLGSDGSQTEKLKLGLTEMIKGKSEKATIYMDGRAVFRFASRVLGSACASVLQQAGKTLDDVDWIVPHQANMRILQSASRDMGVPLEKFYINIEKYANTSAASIPLALTEGLNNGRIKPDDTILMVSFGAGLTWAATLVELSPKMVAEESLFELSDLVAEPMM